MFDKLCSGRVEEVTSNGVGKVASVPLQFIHTHTHIYIYIHLRNKVLVLSPIQMLISLSSFQGGGWRVDADIRDFLLLECECYTFPRVYVCVCASYWSFSHSYENGQTLGVREQP